MLQDGQLDSMHKITRFCIEVNSQVVSLQCVNFQPLQMCIRFQFRKGKKCQWLLEYVISTIRLYPAYSRLPYDLPVLHTSSSRYLPLMQTKLSKKYDVQVVPHRPAQTDRGIQWFDKTTFESYIIVQQIPISLY